MDFIKLYKVLPKEPLKWDFQDVESFLKFINLDNYYEKFKEHSIDGSIIKALDRNDLEKTLKIDNPIAIKKLLQWFHVLDSYEVFVESQRIKLNEDRENSLSPAKIQVNPPVFPKKVTKIIFQNSDYEAKNEEFSPEELSDKILMKASSACLVDKKNSNITTIITNKEERKKSETIFQPHNPDNSVVKMSPENTPENTNGDAELVLQPVEGSQTNFYRFDSKGGKIGRHSSNEMVILEESISRHHAEILFIDGCFHLKDNGSTTGTFIKIPEVILKEKMIIEMGSNQFSIEKILDKENIIEILIIEGSEKNLKKTLNFNTTPVCTFGRKLNNTVSLTSDNHMSNTHSRIQKDNRNFFILEDLNSTNGTWMRLSPELQKSQPFSLKVNTVFKIGLSQSFLVKKIIVQTVVNELEKGKKKLEEKDCVICCENEKNAIFLPCKHNSTCMKCATKLKNCPICREKIENYIQFFKT